MKQHKQSCITTCVSRAALIFETDANFS